MKILIVGDLSEGALALSLSRALSSLGVDAHSVVDDALVPSGRGRRLLARGTARLGAWRQDISSLLPDPASFQPDVVLLVKSPYLNSGSVRSIRRLTGARVVNWLPDDPFLAARPAVTLGALKACDVVVTYSESIAARLISDLHVRSWVIPFGFDPHNYFPSDNESKRRIYDVCFAGQYSRHRERHVEHLLRAGLRLAIRGAGWEQATSPVRAAWSNVPCFGPAVSRLYHQSRVGLNVLHPLNNTGSHNMRTFEILGSGTPMITTDTHQQRALLHGIDGVRYYDSLGSMVSAFTALAGSSERPARGQLACHTYARRCSSLIEKLDEFGTGC